MKHLNTVLISLAFLGLSMSSVWAQSTYIITGSGIQFTATKDGATVSNNQPIQTVIDAIKLDASGSDCTIQFEDGTSTLNTGTANITFDGGTTGEEWGLITLTGKLTSACSVYNNGPICMMNGVSVNSQADITGTASGPVSTTLYNYSTGTLTISGGTVLLTSNTGMAIGNESTGQVHITGGTVEATGANGVTVYTTSKGKITVSGDAKITSKNTNETTPGTIFILDNAGATETCLEITGGTIENTAPDEGTAIVNESFGAINISGGTVSATGIYSTAIVNRRNGEINISGGTVSTIEDHSSAIINWDEGEINISGGTISAAGYVSTAIGNDWTGAINISGGTISADGHESYAIANYSGEINISDGTISTIGDYSKAIYFNHGTLTISGGTVSTTGVEGVAIYNESDGDINISGGTVSTTGYYSVAIGSASGDINISGGTVSATGDESYAIGSNSGDINISGGIVSATGESSTSVSCWSGTLTISGGTVSATTGYAVYNNFYGTLTISGGTISATTGYAVFNSEGTATISGGMVSATTGYAVSTHEIDVTLTGGILFAYGEDETDVIEGDYDMSGNAVIVAWNEAAGTTTYEFNTDDDIYKFPATATAVWTKQGDDSGIAVANGTNTGFIPLPVTITGVGIVETQGIASLKIFPNPTKGELQVTSYELQVTGIEIFDVMGRTVGANLRVCPMSNAINISHLPNGVYFLKIGNKTAKIIKN